jgi:hypothetical protein
MNVFVLTGRLPVNTSADLWHSLKYLFSCPETASEDVLWP